MRVLRARTSLHIERRRAQGGSAVIKLYVQELGTYVGHLTIVPARADRALQHGGRPAQTRAQGSARYALAAGVLLVVRTRRSGGSILPSLSAHAGGPMCACRVCMGSQKGARRAAHQRIFVVSMERSVCASRTAWPLLSCNGGGALRRSHLRAREASAQRRTCTQHMHVRAWKG